MNLQMNVQPFLEITFNENYKNKREFHNLVKNCNTNLLTIFYFPFEVHLLFSLIFLFDLLWFQVLYE